MKYFYVIASTLLLLDISTIEARRNGRLHSGETRVGDASCDVNCGLKCTLRCSRGKLSLCCKNTKEFIDTCVQLDEHVLEQLRDVEQSQHNDAGLHVDRSPFDTFVYNDKLNEKLRLPFDFNY